MVSHLACLETATSEVEAGQICHVAMENSINTDNCTGSSLQTVSSHLSRKLHAQRNLCQNRTTTSTLKLERVPHSLLGRSGGWGLWGRV